MFEKQEQEHTSEESALGQCLEKSDDIPGKYTDLQKNNIRYWKFLYRFEVATPKFLNQFAVVDVSPDKLPIETDEGCQQSLSKMQNTSSAQNS